MAQSAEEKKKRYRKPVLLDFGEGSKARERIILWAISYGIPRPEVERILEELSSKLDEHNTQSPEK